MWSQIAPAFRITLVMTILTGLIYPAVVTGVAQMVFPNQARGSLVTVDGKVVGSELIGQNFSKPEYFHPRPSAAGAGYDGALSSGSNYGPTNQKLADRVKASVEQYRQENPDYSGPIPADAVTTSASGLDPHITLPTPGSGGEWQGARNIAAVRQLVDQLRIGRGRVRRRVAGERARLNPALDATCR